MTQLEVWDNLLSKHFDEPTNKRARQLLLMDYEILIDPYGSPITEFCLFYTTIKGLEPVDMLKVRTDKEWDELIDDIKTKRFIRQYKQLTSLGLSSILDAYPNFNDAYIGDPFHRISDIRYPAIKEMTNEEFDKVIDKIKATSTK